MLKDRHWIAARIPHAEKMCLLQGVVEWDEAHAICITNTHRTHDNPLRKAGALACIHGVEYAAQAMAVHGALLADARTKPRAGYLVSVRDVQWQVDRLDTVEGDLQIAVARMSGDDNTVLYAFELSADERTLMSGRAAVVMDADRLAGEQGATS